MGENFVSDEQNEWTGNLAFQFSNLVGNANEFLKFGEQFVGKFDTPKNSKLDKISCSNTVQISVSLSIFDGFQYMRAQNLSQMV